MIRSLFLIFVVSLLMTNSPATVAGQTGTPVPPPLAACTVTPRTPEELVTLLGDDFVLPPPAPAAVQATPGGEWQIGIAELPKGTPVDSGEVTAVAHQSIACREAGDGLRYLALFTDDAIVRRRALSFLATVMATPEAMTPAPGNLGEVVQFRGLFHARVLANGRVAAVSPPGFLGVPEIFYFVRQDKRWLIDDVVPVGGPHAISGITGNTYTGDHYVREGMSDFIHYGFGLEWGPEWTPVIDPESNTGGVVVLTNGVSFIAAGFPVAEPGSDLAECVHPKPRDLASSLKHVGLPDVAPLVKQGLTPVPAGDGSPLQGADEQRALAIYDVVDPDADGTMRIYLECRTMAGGAWILGVTQIVPAANYEAEAVRRDELLSALEDWDPGR